MNILNLLDKLSNVNTEDSQKQSRRESLTGLGVTGTTIAAAVLPAAILSGIPFGVASAKTGNSNAATIVEILNFALTLEYLESDFYNQGLSYNVMDSADRAIFEQIAKHENAHVMFLKTAIQGAGGTPISKPTFDFTAHGNFVPFANYEDFLQLSQAFEDTGVRAYKGQAGGLMSDRATLTAALQIHSVEARHASEVRRLRTKKGWDTARGWITGNSKGTLNNALQATYNGEENTIQGGLSYSAFTTVSASAVSEAFDEPLTMAATLAIAANFNP